MRTTVILAAVFAAAVWAAPAQAKMVYVKNAGGVEPAVYVASDHGQGPAAARHRPRADDLAQRPVGRVRDRAGRRGAGDGRAAEARLRLAAARHERAARSARCASRPTRASSRAIAGGKRVRVYDIAADMLRTAARGTIRGYSFSPDSRADRRRAGAQRTGFQAPSDLFIGPALGGERSCGSPSSGAR